MSESLSRPAQVVHQFRRVAILFAGGPAPGANAVISTAATSFMRNGTEVLGMKHGYSSLAEYSPGKPLVEGQDYVKITPEFLKRTRSGQGIMLGTARTRSGQARLVTGPSRRRRAVEAAQERLRGAAVAGRRGPDLDRRRRHAEDGEQVRSCSKTACRPTPRGSRSCTLPKTIDNDYHGHRLHVRLLHRGGHARQRDPQPPLRRRCRPGHTFSARRWAAAPAGFPTAAAIAGEASLGDQRGRHPRQVSAARKRSPAPMARRGSSP